MKGARREMYRRIRREGLCVSGIEIGEGRMVEV
jgi:hypothetical protein